MNFNTFKRYLLSFKNVMLSGGGSQARRHISGYKNIDVERYSISNPGKLLGWAKYSLITRNFSTYSMSIVLCNHRNCCKVSFSEKRMLTYLIY